MSFLWTVTSHGRAFVLSTAAQHWQELQYHGVDLKRVSSHEFFTWAIGGDHRIYIYVPHRDVPIRCRAVTYENQRWNPMHGFSHKLLPTDRPNWSSADGLVAHPLESFQLPSENWQWEEEWFVEDNLDGQPLEPEGWTYAIDFPARYGPDKTWNSLVRRRKWVRYRRFAAMNKWAAVPSIHEDPVQEPFIDISIGGTDIPGGDTEKFSVWAVTVLGRILFRYGVTTNAPEGTGWVPVTIQHTCEVSQVSVGPTGLVWAVTWAGNALVRLGVTRESIMGSSWVTVQPPSDDDKLTQISVGTNAVWAITQNFKVWFRKGINGFDAGTNEAAAQGCGWIEMVGEMMVVGVGVNDQVWAIDKSGHTVYIRTGVSRSELSGKTWKLIEVPVKSLNRYSSISSLESDSSANVSKAGNTFSDSSSVKSLSDSRKMSYDSPQSSPFMSNRNERTFSFPPNNSKKESISSNNSSQYIPLDSMDAKTSALERLSICGADDSSYNADFPTDVWDSALGGIDNMETFHDEFNWMWISGSGCCVDSEALPPWFTENISLGPSGPGEAWYDDLLTQFKKRQHREVQQFSSIPRAIEKSLWVKSGACEWNKGNGWIKCLLELQQQGSEQGAEKGILTFNHKKEQLVIDLSEITYVVRFLERNKPFLGIYTHKCTTRGKPYRVSFTAEEDLDDWLATLNNSVRGVNNLPQKPDKISAWATTTAGDVYVHCASTEMESKVPSKMVWILLGGGHLNFVETCDVGIVWGLGYNCTAWVYTSGYGGGPYRGISGCNSSIGPMCDTRCLYIYENQRWNPLTGFTCKGLPTDRYMWSDRTGRFECTKENTHLPCSHWQWISDWCIDYKTPGGVDNQGWQYATDFPRSYHAYKSFTDYVRRRRWIRKCRLLTSGPWKQLGTTPLLDVSLQADAPSGSDKPITVWAVATNGDVLSRTNVSFNCPTGTSWVHVKTDKPFRSISVGAGNVVWGVLEDGSAELRHGIGSEAPTGLFWCHVEPPQVGIHLRQISAGKNTVMAVDENNKLWSRQEIVEIFKEGTHWKLVSEDVRKVSVGSMDQVWAILDKFETPSGVLFGVICQRVGITDENKCGTEWKQATGGTWNHICIRGCLFESNVECTT